MYTGNGIRNGIILLIWSFPLWHHLISKLCACIFLKMYKFLNCTNDFKYNHLKSRKINLLYIFAKLNVFGTRYVSLTTKIYWILNLYQPEGDSTAKERSPLKWPGTFSRGCRKFQSHDGDRVAMLGTRNFYTWPRSFSHR